MLSLNILFKIIIFKTFTIYIINLNLRIHFNHHHQFFKKIFIIIFIYQLAIINFKLMYFINFNLMHFVKFHLNLKIVFFSNHFYFIKIINHYLNQLNYKTLWVLLSYVFFIIQILISNTLIFFKFFIYNFISFMLFKFVLI